MSRSRELAGRLIPFYHLVTSESPMQLHEKYVISRLLHTSGGPLVHRDSRWIVLLGYGFSHLQTTLVNLSHCLLPSVSRDVHSCRPVAAAAATGKTKLWPNQEASKRWGCYWIDHPCHCMLSEAGGTDRTSDLLICHRMQKNEGGCPVTFSGRVPPVYLSTNVLEDDFSIGRGVGGTCDACSLIDII